jgi:general stress protein 26
VKVRTTAVAWPAILVATLSMTWAGKAQASQAIHEPSVVKKAAREVMQKAHFCTLVTVGEDGQPQARIMDPFAPEDDFTIWLATRSTTRKVGQIEKDPRVTLLYFDHADLSEVTVLGKAELVRDPAEKARHWNPAWRGFYEDENRGDDYLLIRVTPSHLEIVSPARGLGSDPQTWRPIMLDLSRGVRASQ